MGDLSDFERGQFVGASLAGAFVTKTTTLLGVLRVTVSKVMLAAYTSHGNTTSVKRNSGRKSTLTERDCHTLRRIVLKNYTTTAVHELADTVGISYEYGVCQEISTEN
jgi:transposase